MVRRSILAAAVAVVAIVTACADSTAPHNDCVIVNGAQVCVPS
jgi:hypothetical protein